MAEKKANRKHKPFPKKPHENGGHGPLPIDFEALKQLYLEGPDYDWAPFCERHNFARVVDRDRWRRNHGVDFQEWKREWLRKQAGIHDDEIAPQVLNLRKVIAQARVDLVQDWVNRSKYFKALLDGVLRAHGEALQHDERNAALIRQKQVEKKFLMTAEDLSTLALSAQRIQDIELKSLLIMSTSAPGSGPLMEPGSTTPEGDDEPREFQVTTMGQAGMTAAESARALAHWFDQAPEPEHVEAEEMPDEDG